MGTALRAALLFLLLVGQRCTASQADVVDVLPSSRFLLSGQSTFSKCLKSIKGLTLLFKGDSKFETAKNRMSNAYFPSLKVPQVITYPADPKQAAAVILCATKFNVKLAVRGGGHNYEGLSLVNNGVVIDTRYMDKITFGTRKGKDVVTIQAGQRIGPVNAKVWIEKKKFVPTGVCPSVGYIANVIGGGLGPNLRKLGLASDALVEAELVTANGRIVKCSKEENPDLFFAVAGAQGNFGLVTSITMMTYTPPPLVSVMQVNWPTTKANVKNMYKAFFAWDTVSLPPEFGYVELFIGKSDDQIHLLHYYWGSTDDLQKLYDTNPVYKGAPGSKIVSLQQFDKYGDFAAYFMKDRDTSYPPLSSWLSLDTVISKAFDNNPGRASYKASSAFLFDALDDAAIDKLTEVVYKWKDVAWTQVHPLGGAVTKKKPTETAFPSRDAKYQLQIYIYEYNEQYITEVQAAIKPFATGLQYVNYIDTDTKNPWQTYFGVNAKRLLKTKKKYDPKNVFDALNQR